MTLAAPSTLDYDLWMVGEPNPKRYGECRIEQYVTEPVVLQG